MTIGQVREWILSPLPSFPSTSEFSWMNRAVILLGSFCIHNTYVILQVLAGNLLFKEQSSWIVMLMTHLHLVSQGLEYAKFAPCRPSWCDVKSKETLQWMFTKLFHDNHHYTNHINVTELGISCIQIYSATAVSTCLVTFLRNDRNRGVYNPILTASETESESCPILFIPWIHVDKVYFYKKHKLSIYFKKEHIMNKYYMHCYRS